MTGTDLYLIRDFVPDFEAIAAEFSARSRALEARVTIHSDIAYGTGRRETMDIVLPDKPVANAPLHVFVHGGYWRSGDKADYRLVAEPVLRAGGIAALVEYDLMPGARLSVLVNQVRSAVRWLQSHALDIGVDPARITVSGHSAGAHLASYLAALGPDETENMAFPTLRGLLLVSGIYDLSGIPNSFLRNEARMTVAEAAAWSPLKSSQCPSPHRTIAFGTQETQPFHEQASALHGLLGNSDLVPVPGLNHMNIVLDLADYDGILGRRVADMVSM